MECISQLYVPKNVCAHLLNGDTVSLDRCLTIGDIRVRLSQVQRPVLPQDVVLATFPVGAHLNNNDLPAPGEVYAITKNATERTADVWKEALSVYSACGDVAGVRWCIHELAELDPHYAHTLLLDAADCGDVQMARVLLDTGGSYLREAVNSQDEDGNTPLHFAVLNDGEDILKLLLSVDNVDVNARNKWGWTPLHWAVQNARNNVLGILLARSDVEVNAEDDAGATALYIAVLRRDVDIITQLLARKEVDVNSRHAQWMPLHWATRFGHTEVVGMLLAREDVAVNAHDGDGWTALHWATRFGHIEVVGMLLARQDVAVDSEDREGLTPRMWAEKLDRTDVLEMMDKRKS